MLPSQQKERQRRGRKKVIENIYFLLILKTKRSTSCKVRSIKMNIFSIICNTVNQFIHPFFLFFVDIYCGCICKRANSFYKLETVSGILQLQQNLIVLPLSSGSKRGYKRGCVGQKGLQQFKRGEQFELSLMISVRQCHPNTPKKKDPFQ